MEILIVDDHPVFRAGLRQILLDYSQDLVVSEVGSGREALRCLDVRAPDAVVLDISLPDLNGIEVLRRIRRIRPSLPVILLTMHAEEQYEVSANKAGASAFLSKAAEPDRVAEAILWFAQHPLNGGSEGGNASKPHSGLEAGRRLQQPPVESHKLR